MNRMLGIVHTMEEERAAAKDREKAFMIGYGQSMRQFQDVPLVFGEDNGVLAAAFVRAIVRSDRTVYSAPAIDRTYASVKIETKSFPPSSLTVLENFIARINKKLLRTDPTITSVHYDPLDADIIVEQASESSSSSSSTTTTTTTAAAAAESKEEKKPPQGPRPCPVLENRQTIDENVGTVQFGRGLNAGRTEFQWAKTPNDASIVFWMSPDDRAATLFAALDALRGAGTMNQVKTHPKLVAMMFSQVPVTETKRLLNADFQMFAAVHRCGIIETDVEMTSAPVKRPLSVTQFCLAITVPLLNCLRNSGVQGIGYDLVAHPRSIDATVGLFRYAVARILARHNDDARFEFSRVHGSDVGLWQRYEGAFRAIEAEGGLIRNLLAANTTSPSLAMQHGLLFGRHIDDMLKNANNGLRYLGASGHNGKDEFANSFGDMLGTFKSHGAREWCCAGVRGIDMKEAKRLLLESGQVAYASRLTQFTKDYLPSGAESTMLLVNAPFASIVAALGKLDAKAQFRVYPLSLHSSIVLMATRLFFAFTTMGNIRAIDAQIASGRMTVPLVERLTTSVPIFRLLASMPDEPHSNEVVIALDCLHRLCRLPDTPSRGDEEHQARSLRVINWVKAAASKPLGRNVTVVHLFPRDLPTWDFQEKLLKTCTSEFHVNGCRKKPEKTDLFAVPIEYLDQSRRQEAAKILDVVKRGNDVILIEVILGSEPDVVIWLAGFFSFAPHEETKSLLTAASQQKAMTFDWVNRARCFMRPATFGVPGDCGDVTLLYLLAYMEREAYGLQANNADDIYRLAMFSGRQPQTTDSSFPSCRLLQHGCVYSNETPLAVQMQRDGPRACFNDWKFPVRRLCFDKRPDLMITDDLASLCALVTADANFDAAFDACNGTKRGIQCAPLFGIDPPDRPQPVVVVTPTPASASQSSSSSSSSSSAAVVAQPQEVKAATPSVPEADEPMTAPSSSSSVSSAPAAALQDSSETTTTTSADEETEPAVDGRVFQSDDDEEDTPVEQDEDVCFKRRLVPIVEDDSTTTTTKRRSSVPDGADDDELLDMAAFAHSNESKSAASKKSGSSQESSQRSSAPSRSRDDDDPKQGRDRRSDRSRNRRSRSSDRSRSSMSSAASSKSRKRGRESPTEDGEIVGQLRVTVRTKHYEKETTRELKRARR